MTEAKQPKRKVIKTAAAMGKYMADYYYELDNAAKTGERKIAWCTSVGPAEILRTMGFVVYFPETHAAMLGSTRMSTDLIPHATALGYSPEVCSYMTADIGAYLQKQTPLTKTFKGIEGIPKPDVLVYNTNQCRDVQDWFGFYAREFNAPILGISGNVTVNASTDAIVTGVALQMQDLIAPLEEISGNAFDMDKLKEVVGLSRQCSDTWKQVLEAASATPSPLTFFDGCTLMGPAVVGRGTPEAVKLYKQLLAELEERVAQKDGAIENERFRLYWDGMPVWGRLSAHSKLFASLDTNVLASTYCSSWIFSALDAEDPFNSMAKAYTDLFIVRSEDYKEAYIKEKLEMYQVDGIIYHDAKTCPNNSNCRYGMSNRIQEKTGIPSLVIDGDLNDLRCVSDEQTKTNVEAFIEQLEESK
ncbi:MAG: 2-hydroxyacyl-CoA dehydratase [Desulfatitalea sp.]|nr:2-hydroxyacyl-CoA dehydratase family protein [Desulfatitalea sp.]NNK02009.1 2-hydroxyacyl-CoA dehydratase [Desulfatitalea sp.]